jgi:hypothetical protein
MRSGDADLDHDGTITPDELFDYACDRLRADGRSQTPRKWALDVGGAIVLSRAGARRGTPLPAFAAKSGGPPAAPGRPRWAISALAAGAVVLVAIVLALTLGGGGDSPQQVGQNRPTTATIGAPAATAAAPTAVAAIAPVATNPPPPSTAPAPAVRIVGPTLVTRNVQTCWTVEWTSVVGGTWSLPGFNLSNPSWGPGEGFCATVTGAGSYILTLRATANDGRTATSSLTFAAS